MIHAISNFVRTGALAAALVCSATALAEAAPITGVPQFKDFSGAGEMPDPSLDYKIAFDINSMAASPDQVNPAIKMVGALINAYESHGVSPDHLHLTAVFHGPTIQVVLDDATYKARTGVERNPNVDLLNQLKSHGVQLVVCGQSAMAQHYDFKNIAHAKVNFSASVTFINLMTRGYMIQWTIVSGAYRTRRHRTGFHSPNVNGRGRQFGEQLQAQGVVERVQQPRVPRGRKEKPHENHACRPIGHRHRAHAWRAPLRAKRPRGIPGTNHRLGIRAQTGAGCGENRARRRAHRSQESGGNASPAI